MSFAESERYVIVRMTGGHNNESANGKKKAC